MTENPWDDDAPSKKLNYWRLCDELSVLQATLLVLGHDPAGPHAYAENKSLDNQPTGYEAVKTGISRALKSGDIDGVVKERVDYDMHGNEGDVIEDSVCAYNSYVQVESLRKWLFSRGFGDGFFFADGAGKPDYLDPSHSRYAPKLAAAVNAWLAMEDESARGNSSPKMALEKWLRQHAAEFGLSKDDGNPNENGIKEISKVANWDMRGGAPKTPG